MKPRLKWLKDQLESMKLDGMIISNPVNIRYLTGLTEEGTFVVSSRENVFITDSRYIESVNMNLTIDDEIVAYDQKDLNSIDYENFFDRESKVGFEENYVTYSTYQKYLSSYKVNLVETDSIIEKQRVVKDEEEIELIKKACEITDNAFDYIIHNIRKGMTEKEVAFEIEKYMITHGGDSLAFDSIVAFGENTSKPHAVPTDRVIASGDIIQFDIGCKYQGYCADFSRVVFVDEINEEYKLVYDFVLEQQNRIKSSFKEGVNIKTVIKDRQTDYNLRRYDMMHAFGHSLGLEIHESPVLRSNVDNYLKNNTVLAIEPGVYFPGKFGIRIEDTFLVGKMYTSEITKSSKEMTVIRLK